MVGSMMLKVLEERNFPITELIPVATEKSIGKPILFKGREYKVIGMEDAIAQRPNIALFSAGGNTSLEFAPKYAEVDTIVIDNSSAWRMDSSKKLIVPEINAHQLTKDDRIIANPNCSTIQMVILLNPLHQKYKIKRLVISTYQSVSGTCAKAVKQIENERNGIVGEMAYHYKIDKNCIPQCDVFLENGYTKEEMKMVYETRKILSDDTIRVTATAVRVPVTGGHSEAVNIEFENDYDLHDVRTILANTDGVIVEDDNSHFKYPMPLYAFGKDDVFVGRIRRDDSNPNSLNLWIVADNLRKGAATNAVQIAEYLVKNNLA